MATYFVASGGSNTAPYDTWAKAATSLQTALTAASTAGDIVVIQYDGVPTGDSENAVAPIYTYAASVSLISASNDGGSDYTPTQMGDSYWIGAATGNINISFAGTGFQCYVYGVTVRAGGSSTRYIYLTTDGMSAVYENCTIWLGNTGASSAIRPNTGAGSHNATCVLKGCSLRFAHTEQQIDIVGKVELYSCSIHASSSAPSELFGNISNAGYVFSDGCDYSLSGSTMVGSPAALGMVYATFANCKVPGSLSWLATQSPLTLASSEVYVFNCASGDTHYNFGYYNALGSVVSTTGIYASGGAKYDGTNGVSWQIDTSSAASFGTPFVTPWIDQYHSGTSAITPKLEILRDGSSTAYDNDEVWAEFSYQGTSGSTKATIVDDRMALGGTPAAQTTGDLGAGDWTGEGGTAWFGKLNPTSAITPAEIGMLRARVCVGVASQTVYVDPFIRVA